MRKYALVLALSLMLSPALAMVSEGEHFRDQSVVNIETYRHFEIQVGKGQKVRIEARVEALSYPVSVFLVKGMAEYDKFVQTDLVNVDDIKGGNISEIDDSFTVISTFSERSTLLFDRSMTIGEADSYFLVVMLYRNSSMDAEEVLTSRATLVNFDVEWGLVEKDVPYYLIPIAIAFLLVGIGLLAYYFWPRDATVPEGTVIGPRETARRPPVRPPSRGRGRSGT